MPTENNCPELARLVERLAESINERKRVETDESHTTKQRMAVDQDTADALEAVRAHKSEHQCELAETRDSVA